MGAAPAFNITVETSGSTAERIATAVAGEFGFERDVEDAIQYTLEVPDEMDSGRMNTSNDILSIGYIEGRNEYFGVGADPQLVIHYSPYYFEAVTDLKNKLELLDDIEQFVTEFVDGLSEDPDVEYVASTCTV